MKKEKNKPSLTGKAAFDAFYKETIAVAAILIGCAVLAAVYIEVMLGIVIAVSTAVIYIASVNRKMKKTMGLKYSPAQGGIAVHILGNAECKEIPDRIMWMNVVELGASGKKAEAVSETLRLPCSLCYIDEGAFDNADKLNMIIFEGSASQFKKIACRADLTGKTIVYLGGMGEEKK